MRAANPTVDYKELARQIGDRWKSLSEDAKRVRLQLPSPNFLRPSVFNIILRFSSINPCASRMN